MMRRYASLSLQIVISLVLLAVLFRQFDWDAVSTTIAQVPPTLYAAALLAVIAGQLLYAWRWQVVLGALGLRVPYGEVVRQQLLGLFFGSLMPTAVGGDAAKVYYLGGSVGYVHAGASVLVDRFLGFLWLSIFGAGLAWAVGASTPLLELNRNLLTAFAAAFVVLLALIAAAPVESLIPDVLRRGRLAAVVPPIEKLLRGIQVGGCRPHVLAVSGVVVAIYVTMLSVVYSRYFAASGQAMLDRAPIMNAVISMSIFVNVPITVNGIGLREQLHYLLFGELGVAKEVAVSLSVLMFSCAMLLSAAGWVVWLRLRRVPA
jgi:glycosyltransferase 2 family protein